MKRVISLILLVLMILPVAVGCANGDNNIPNQTTPSEGTTSSTPSGNETTPPETTLFEQDGIGDDVNLNAETITFLYWDDTESQEFFADEQNGDSVNDAIYYRNMTVEERLNVSMAFVGTPGNYNNLSSFRTKATTDVTSGLCEFDIFADYSMGIATLASENFTVDLRQYDVLDFSKPWWPDNLLNESTIYDKLYFASGDISTNMLYQMYCCFFNKVLLADHGLESPYDLVEKNEWTLDKMIEMCANVYVDNGDGQKSEDDVFGFSVTSDVHCDPFYYGSGLKTMDKDADGAPIVSPDMSSEKAINMVKKVKSFLNDGNKAMIGTKIFADGRSLFHYNKVQLASKTLKDGVFEYGVVPVPKFDSAQENFSTVLAFPYSLYAISSGSKKDEAAATVLECMASESYRQVTPVLFEDCMKIKYASDEKTSKMYDILRETVSFDIGRIFTESFNKITYQLFRKCIKTSDAPEYATEIKSQIKIMEKLVKKFAENFAKRN